MGETAAVAPRTKQHQPKPPMIPRQMLSKPGEPAERRATAPSTEADGGAPGQVLGLPGLPAVSAGAPPYLPPGTPSAIAMVASRGLPLDSKVAYDVGTEMGADLRHVRIHTDSDGAQLAGAVNAHAFAIGSHVFFGEGEYQPGTVRGRQLMRHELAHIAHGDTKVARIFRDASREDKNEHGTQQRQTVAIPAGQIRILTDETTTKLGISHPTNSGSCRISLNGLDREGRPIIGGAAVELILQPGESAEFYAPPPGSAVIAAGAFADAGPAGGSFTCDLRASSPPPKPAAGARWGDLTGPDGVPNAGVVDWLREGYVPEPVKDPDDIHLANIELVSGKPARFRISYRDGTKREIPWTEITKERTPHLWAEKDRINTQYGPGLLDFVILSGLTTWSMVGSPPMGSGLTTTTAPRAGGLRPYIPRRVPLSTVRPTMADSVPATSPRVANHVDLPAVERSPTSTASVTERTTRGYTPPHDDAVVSPDVQQRIISMEKGTRPDPVEYLPHDYIKNHLDKFDNGATRFMSKSNLEKYGIAQSDGTSFVIPRDQADALINASNGNARTIESALGLPEGFLDSNTLVQIDIDHPADYGLRLPSGNEAGANSQWLPGGRLPNGLSEAVINGAKIPPSGYHVHGILKR